MNLIKSTFGFSMLEGMIALGLVAAASVGVMNVMSNAKKVEIFSRSASDVLQLGNAIQKLLDNPRHCQASLKGVSFRKRNIDFAGQEIMINSALGAEGKNIELWQGNPNGDRTFLKHNASNNSSGFNAGNAVPVGNAPVPNNNIDRSSYGNNVKIDSLKIFANNGLGTGANNNYPTGLLRDEATIVMKFTKKISATDYRQMRKMFNVAVNIQTNNAGLSEITSCNSLAIDLAGALTVTTYKAEFINEGGWNASSIQNLDYRSALLPPGTASPVAGLENLCIINGVHTDAGGQYNLPAIFGATWNDSTTRDRLAFEALDVHLEQFNGRWKVGLRGHLVDHRDAPLNKVSVYTSCLDW